MKRFRAFVLAVLLVSASAVAQEELAFAIVPGVALVFASGGMAIGYFAAVALVGGGILAISFFHTEGDPQSGALDVYLPSSPKPVPAGWTAGSDPTQDPVPPSSATSSSVSTSGWAWVDIPPVQGWGATKEAACADGCYISYGGGVCESVGTVSADGLRCEFRNSLGYIAGTKLLFAETRTVVSCPPGYSASGSNCVLSNPSAVPYPSDGRARAKVDAGGITVDPRDPDHASNVSGSGTQNLRVTGSGTHWTDVQQNGDGSVTVTEYKGNGDGTTSRTSYDIGPDGKLRGGSLDRVQGEGTTASNGDRLQGAECGVPGKPPCQFDVDGSAFDGWAAQGEALRSGVEAAYQSRHDQVAGMGDQGGFGIGLEWLPSLKPGAVVECQPLPVSMHFGSGVLAGLGADDSIDICDKAGLLRQIFGYIFGLWAIWSIASTFFEANKGA